LPFKVLSAIILVTDGPALALASLAAAVAAANLAAAGN
jgi:hypothetical protein